MLLTKTEEKEKNKVEKRELYREVDKKTSKRVFINLILSVVLMAYFCGMGLVFNQVGQSGIINIVKICTISFLAISLILIEIAYKKKSKVLIFHAFEVLVLAIYSLTTMHITKMYNFNFNNYILVAAFIFALYYVFKAFIIVTKARKEYLKQLIDISEIVKKEHPIKKEAVKKQLEDNENEEKPKAKFNNKKLQEIRAKLRELQKQDVEIENKIKEDKKKKDKKEDKKIDINLEEKKETPKKKRGRPKKEKVQEEKIEEKKEEKTENKVEENKEIKVETTKKKRGRPKKEVKIND